MFECINLIKQKSKRFLSIMYKTSGKSNNDLVNGLINENVIKSKEVETVMKMIDRGDYCPNQPYDDSPQVIGYKATISAPHMHAYALELLKSQLVNGTKALDVGSGSGYLTVAMAYMMRKNKGTAYGIEHIPELAEKSVENILNCKDKELYDSKNVQIFCGDGRLGIEKCAPFDAIHVGAAAEKMPQTLIDQLANGGRMVIPVGGSDGQDFLVVDKDSKGKVTQTKALSVRYVPLTDKEKQWPSIYK